MQAEDPMEQNINSETYASFSEGNMSQMEHEEKVIQFKFHNRISFTIPRTPLLVNYVLCRSKGLENFLNFQIFMRDLRGLWPLVFGNSKISRRGFYVRSYHTSCV